MIEESNKNTRDSFIASHAGGRVMKRRYRDKEMGRESVSIQGSEKN
jgi:hypothetical protein